MVPFDGHNIVVIRVPEGRLITATNRGVYKHRLLNVHGEPQCLPFYPHEMQSREASRGAFDFSAMIVPHAEWDDLDPLEFERLRQTITRDGARADAALLLLGREESLRRLLPMHEVAFQAMSGARVNVNDSLRWPLIKRSDELTSRFDARNEEEAIMIGAVRAGIPDYSRAGYREAVHYALVHRDYAAKGAVHVFWRSEEIEIVSPGGFPDAVHIGNLLVTGPRPRNPVLADAFKRIGLVERTGRGIDTIFSERRIDVERAAELLQKGEPTARAVLERLVEASVMEARGVRAAAAGTDGIGPLAGARADDPGARYLTFASLLLKVPSHYCEGSYDVRSSSPLVLVAKRSTSLPQKDRADPISFWGAPIHGPESLRRKKPNLCCNNAYRIGPGPQTVQSRPDRHQTANAMLPSSVRIPDAPNSPWLNPPNLPRGQGRRSAHVPRIEAEEHPHR